MTAAELRRDLSRRNLEWARDLAHDVTFGDVPSVVHAEGPTGGHGNFHPASWRRLQANAGWHKRLEKTYTAGRRLPRQHDRWRGELECATSSDALLMNVFCYPGIFGRQKLLTLTGVDPGSTPVFGLRAAVPLSGGRVDRTEIDMRAGDLLVEGKLTETDFQVARASLVMRYRDLDHVFDLEDLPRTPSGDFASYQLVRSVLAAHALECRFAVVLDGRRFDLIERWFAVLRAVRGGDLRQRLQLLTWQEIAATCPPSLQRFLGAKYGIVPVATDPLSSTCEGRSPW